jgi:hypothetical protein
MAILPITRTFTQDGFARQRATSAGATTSCVMRATPGWLDSFLVHNNSAVDGWLQFHDAASLPSNSAVPLFPPIKLSAYATVGMSDIPLFGAVGIVAVISTTEATLTLSSNTAFFYGNCRN